MPMSRRELLCFLGGIIAYGTVSQLYGGRSIGHSVSLEDFTLSVVGVVPKTSLQQNQQERYTSGRSSIAAEANGQIRQASVRSESTEANDDDDDDDDAEDDDNGGDDDEAEEADADPNAKAAAIQEVLDKRNRRTRPPRGELKLPTPIFLLSLPKSGTTSTHKFFACGLGNPWASANHWIENATGFKKRVGQCMYENVRNNRDIIQGCGGYKVFTDMGATWVASPNAPRVASNCYYPSIHGLEAIYNQYPKATIMNIYRNSTSWAQSMFTWNNLAGRLGLCPGFPVTPFLPAKQTYDNLHEWIEFYDRHTETIRQFAKDHPSLTYVEAALEPDETAGRLHQQTGLDADCWKKCKPESGCVETDQNGNELPPKKVRAGRSGLNFAPYSPGGTLFAKPKPTTSLSSLLKVSTPIFVLSLPRSKLIKVYQYFKCGFRKTNNDVSNIRFRNLIAKNSEGEAYDIEIARLMWKNKKEGLSLMEGIDETSVLTDIGSVFDDNGTPVCYFPSVHDLQGLLDSTSSPTFMLFTRDSAVWANELHASNNLMGRLSIVCGDFGLPKTPFLTSDRTAADVQKWADFYEAHTESLREFAAEHPSLTYIEIDMDDEPAERLEMDIGIPSSCWD